MSSSCTSVQMAGGNISATAAAAANSTMDTDVLSHGLHDTIGVIYLLSGIIGLVGNAVLLCKLNRDPPYKNPGRNALLISLAVTNAGVVGGFFLTTSSCFAKRWLFGTIGCQFYGFIGMLFGITSIYHFMFIAMDIYNHRDRADTGLKRRNYLCQVLLCWSGGLITALMPLFGWASYAEDPSKHSCNLNWQVVNTGYISYLICVTVMCYVIPYTIMTYCYVATTLVTQKNKNDIANIEDVQHDNLERKLFKLIGCLIIFSLVAWSPYAIICINSLFNNPKDVPVALTAMPGLIIKISYCVIPQTFIIYIYNCRGVISINSTAVSHQRRD